MIQESLISLIRYCEDQGFSGYDPYDALNSKIHLNWLGKYPSALAIQFQKRNPVNIRSLIGVKKGINPKALGLFLKAYSLLYSKTGEKKYLITATSIFEWLSKNYSPGYSGKCWGYNFDWATPGSMLKAFTPSVVVTSFVIDGINEYYKITNSLEAKQVILSASDYIKNDIPIIDFKEGLSFSYTHLSKGCCYNASLLASEILAKADKINGTTDNESLINSSVDYILSRQKPTGEWWYSINENGAERKQIDFHQGFILVSLANLNNLLSFPREDVRTSIGKGLNFYRKYQFSENGQSLWRLPKKWPVDIHNQSQGIITFSKLKDHNAAFYIFAKRIAEWTIENMQSERGFFYYRKTPFLNNKISYMRWSQAWMMLALAELKVNE